MNDDVTVIFYTSQSHKHLATKMVDRLVPTGLRYIWYDDLWLNQNFPDWCRQYQYILRNKRGGGYWLWKPKIILHALATWPGRILYLDASVGWSGDIHQQIVKMKNWYTIRGGYLNGQWTKRDCFALMGCDTANYWNAHQLWAGCIMVDESKKTFLEEWLSYCQNPNIIMDMPNICGQENLPGFREHRHDQSILTNLVIKWNLRSYEDTFFEDVN